MLELILSIIADFGLIREDTKHIRKISEKEKADGRKRPFQKYFLQPSSIVVITFFIVVAISTLLFFYYQNTSIFPKKTKKEIIEISERMEKWKEKFGKYPKDLRELIGNNPMRQEWTKDAWNHYYQYSLTETAPAFQLYLQVQMENFKRMMILNQIKNNR